MIWSLAFWKGTGERALKTFVQAFIPSLLLTLGATSTGALDAFHAPWLTALATAGSCAVGAAFLSFCTSLGNAQFTAGPPVPVAPAPAPAPVVNVAPAAVPAPADPSQPAAGVPPAV